MVTTLVGFRKDVAHLTVCQLLSKAETKPDKEGVAYDESCFRTDTVVRREVKKTISYRRVKTQKHLVSIGLPCSAFPFYEHFNRQFTYAGIFYIQNRKMCLSKKILNQQIVVFSLAWGNFSPEKILIHFFIAVTTQQ